MRLGWVSASVFPQLWSAFVGEKPGDSVTGRWTTTPMASVLPVPKAMKKALGVVVVGDVFFAAPKNAKKMANTPNETSPPYKNYWTLSYRRDLDLYFAGFCFGSPNH